MTVDFEAIVAGAGPAGLACASALAAHGKRVLVVERNREIGPKVCAGGITWSGLLARVPEELIEAAFPVQHIFSRRQRIRVRQKNPIIATVNRVRLGGWMAGEATRRGADILTGVRVTRVEPGRVTLRGTKGAEKTHTCRHIIGADGASSLVRRSIGITASGLGPGINYQLAGSYPDMEWHLNNRLFACGYAWIFPHRDAISIGAYCPAGVMAASQLQQACIRWARTRGFDLQREPCRAAMISYDYRGIRFPGNIWLAGDAAGLASGLTGEGIFPAIVSGEEVAKSILDPSSCGARIDNMVQRQKLHQRIVTLARRWPASGGLLMELLVLLLRLRLIPFHALEMGE